MKKILYLCLALFCLTTVSCSEKAQENNDETMKSEKRYDQPRKELNRPKSVLIISSRPASGWQQ